MAERKYFWLKLKDDFFEEKYVKALRKLPDGDALVIIYLKLQLKSLKTEGIIRYDHIMPSVEEEMALMLDEDINAVRLALQAILNLGIAELWDDETLYLSALQPLIGSETAAAERMRRHREQKSLHCYDDVTGRYTEKRREEIEEEKSKTSCAYCFEAFWSLYPKKKSKGDAEKAWKALSPDNALVDRILASIEQQKKSEQWKKDKGQFIPYPATWLRAKGWEDEDSTPCIDQDYGEPEDFYR